MPRSYGTSDLARIANELSHDRPQNAVQELQHQNQELLRALEEIRTRQAELSRVNRELEDTNRGVVALYAELDEKADHLRRADELKSKFLSNMSHEFRSPLNSILALSGLLLSRSDGELTHEQDQQVGYIKRAAGDLLELVNDLLDLAKVEAGKVEAKPIEFEIANLFAALRGHAPAPAPEPVRGSRLRRCRRHSSPLFRRGKDIADSPQLHFKRPEVHRKGRGPGIGGCFRTPAKSLSPFPTPESGSPLRIRSRSSRISSSSIIRFSGV